MIQKGINNLLEQFLEGDKVDGIRVTECSINIKQNGF